MTQARTIFLSDVHLGTRGCKAEALLDFLKAHAADTLYLVGDIVDGWRLSKAWYWPHAHTAVVEEILHRSQSGTRVLYIPGNHDETLRPYAGLRLGGIEVVSEAVHETAAGERLLVIHGDCFDTFALCGGIKGLLANQGYRLAQFIDRQMHRIRRRLGLGSWSIIQYIKTHEAYGKAIIDRFEAAALAEAHRRGFDGIVCGHIHSAALRREGALLYGNDGDWVETCSALVEDHAGTLSLVHWAPAPAHSDRVDRAAA